MSAYVSIHVAERFAALGRNIEIGVEPRSLKDEVAGAVRHFSPADEPEVFGQLILQMMFRYQVGDLKVAVFG